jgi:disulfide bond formation protein DsbB
MVLVIFGTIAKNRWGINLDPVSCPSCNTQFPQIRQPQSTRQALWGGGTCSKCGTEVDKWGREVTAQRHTYPSDSIEPEDQMRALLNRRLIVYSAVIFFCLTLLLAWLGIRPSFEQIVWKAWPLWMSVIGAAIVETVIFTALFYSASMYLLGRFIFKGRGRASS